MLRRLVARSLVPFLLLLSTCAPLHTSAANSTTRLLNCLRSGGFPDALLSPSGDSSFAVALTQSLIQDPLESPLLFVRPRNTDEVAAAVRCANRADVVFCARSGGHSWSSSSICPGLVIDLQRINFLQVNRKASTMRIGAGKTIGETLYQLYTRTGHVIPTGACPSVGVGGYIQGGGFGTLSGELGLLADNVRSMTVVTPSGNVVKAADRQGARKELFWGLTGGGGGYFGVVTEIQLNTFDASGTYDENVYFAYNWNEKNAPEAFRQWTKYPLSEDGSLYMRLIVAANRQGVALRGVGVCWKVRSKKQCLAKLNQLDLWKVPGRSRELMHKSKEGALEPAKFFTSAGQFANAKPTGPETTRATFLQRFVTKGFLSDRSWSSFIWGPGVSKSTTVYFLRLISLVSQIRRAADLRQLTVEVYPLGTKVRSRPSNATAFPHRQGAAAIAAFYNGGTTAARKRGKARLQRYLARYATGTYVSYQDVDLTPQEYRRLYWGSSLRRLKALKQAYDPNKQMWHPQPVP